MPATALPENYCVCVGEDGAPREIGRSGTAVTYKAMGYESGQAVALQLIPLASVSESGRAQFESKARTVRKLKHPNIARVFEVRVEDDHLVFATEFLQGETAEQWVVAHGPMPPDAVLRIALQIVSALAEAAFHSLSHRAIQPSNLMIVNGAAPDGSWPFVKLLNFGLAGLKLYTEGEDELVPRIGPAFASPEQLEKGKVDFRSEIFSLGATICFLLTGAVPLSGRTRRSAERALPSGVPIPRAVRKLLRRMLRNNPDERPHDPLLLTDELRKCLHKVERRRAFSRHVAVPIETEPPFETADRPGRFVPVLMGATVMLLLAALAAVIGPGQLRSWVHRDRPIDSIGVPIGIPDNVPAASTNVAGQSQRQEALAERNSSVPAAAAPASGPSNVRSTSALMGIAPAKPAEPALSQASSTPALAKATSVPSPAQEEGNASPPPLPDNSQMQSAPVAAERINNEPTPPTEQAAVPEEKAVVDNPEPTPPSEAPPAEVPAATPAVSQEPVVAQQQPVPAQESAESEPAQTVQPEPTSKIPERASLSTAQDKPRRVNSLASRRAGSRPSREGSLPPMRVGTEQARFVRTTADGKWVLRLPSGDTIVTPPLPDTNDIPVISHRKVRKAQIPPRALPVDDGPPVVVLPPEG